MPSKLFDVLAFDSDTDNRSKGKGKIRGSGKIFSARDKNMQKIVKDNPDRDEKRTQQKLKPEPQGSSSESAGDDYGRDKVKGESSPYNKKKPKKTSADKFTHNDASARKKMTPKQKTQAKKAAATAEKKASKAATIAELKKEMKKA